MAVLQESPWYQEILQQGEQNGIRQERLASIELGLEVKFGTEGLQLMPEISQISDLELLKAIQRGVMMVNTIDELQQIYQ
ncbi:hypothetical protein NDI37_14180 [Funiculus sociatus GB2-A5]|uniref:Uncharacterized protein n=1 Tax=Funiculus sociatus GB2-A5 TaxID=2933946 RepID=A0ABV0JQ64_9CYAN|nr:MULTISPECIES: hypothetical protein [unclassified Trichocoleus]MBD1905530.1 hypothetical protein [Trichocoleus sp. FACHB-832]MBD2062257.1 hypothetical protein [Trichocoleus sp. FACHB-6]